MVEAADAPNRVPGQPGRRSQRPCIARVTLVCYAYYRAVLAAVPVLSLIQSLPIYLFKRGMHYSTPAISHLYL